jgi:EAL domain-containing protein (putative c-di-GMP-specific phosphodiesterase class I)
VARHAADWLRRLPADQKFFISVNLSPTALRDPGLSEYVGSLLRETQLPPSLLKFELTEAALISNVAAARETLDRLHGLGLQLMLDDFGTGYSSLSYLQLFPFDFVKIDRPFVNRVASDQANTSMMAAMVQIADSLNLKAIAEIIETEAAAKALQQMGCDYGQGYYFSEPLEVEPALQRLRTQQPFQPPPEPPVTMEIPTLQEEGSPTIVIPVAQHPHQPPEGTSATVKLRPLDEDGSPTIMIPAAQHPHQPPEGTSATVKLRPLDEDGSPTIMIPAAQHPHQPPEGTSATVKLRPLDEDGSPTIMIPAAQHPHQPPQETSATVKVPPLDEDDSPTTVMATGSVEYSREEEEEPQ